MGTFMTRIPRCVYLGIGVIMGSVIKSARKICLNTVFPFNNVDDNEFNLMETNLSENIYNLDNSCIDF